MCVCVYVCVYVCVCIYIILLVRFSLQRKMVVFHWILRDTQSPQVCWTLLCFLVDLKNVDGLLLSYDFHLSQSPFEPFSGSVLAHQLKRGPPSPS